MMALFGGSLDQQTLINLNYKTMKYVLILTVALGFQLGLAQNTIEEANGSWKIDLRPTPDSEAYYQTVEISEAEQNTFKGTFYGSPIENAILNTKWNRLYFAFMTKDASNTYYHSGYILEGKIYGITYCPTRAFTAPWNGVKHKAKN